MEAAENALHAGDRLDRYELLCPIASGGMATVWLARMRGKRGFEKLFAVKTIRTELVEDPRFQEMFLDEARITSGIQHPNVAQILDLGEQKDVLFIVMEWVDGDSLAKIRRLVAKGGGSVPLGPALRILADTCAGLHAAHELHDDEGRPLGIVHRDVSPQNILVSTAGAIKVIDFGIAKAQNRRQGDTRTGIVKGKLQYMAPEQVKKGRTVDRRADIWALGICLHELVAGRLPNEGDDDVEVIRKLLADEAPSCAEGLPEPVAHVLTQSIAIDPDERFSTAAAMQRAIEGAMKEAGESATSEDVAAFIRTALPELAEKRRVFVSEAISKARDRSELSGEPREEVAFAPTIVSDRSARLRPGEGAVGPRPGEGAVGSRPGEGAVGPRSGEGAGPAHSADEARAIALTKRKMGGRIALRRPIGQSGVIDPEDDEPFEIPKRSRLGYWVAFALVLAAGGATSAMRWVPALRGSPRPNAPSRAPSAAAPPRDVADMAADAQSPAMETSHAEPSPAVAASNSAARASRPAAEFAEPRASALPAEISDAAPAVVRDAEPGLDAAPVAPVVAPPPDAGRAISGPAPSATDDDPNNPYNGSVLAPPAIDP